MKKNTLTASNTFVWICILLFPTAGIFFWKITVSLSPRHICTHFIVQHWISDARRCEDPLETTTGHPGPRATSVLWPFLIFLVLVQTLPPQSSHLRWPLTPFQWFSWTSYSPAHLCFLFTYFLFTSLPSPILWFIHLFEGFLYPPQLK